MSNITFLLTKLAPYMSTGADEWKTLKEVISQVLPILWLATAIISTVWMVVKFVSANFQSATGDQSKYEKAKKARKRALFAWIIGCLWPVLFMIAWPIAKEIYGAIGGDKTELPDLFEFGESSGMVGPTMLAVKEIFRFSK